MELIAFIGNDKETWGQVTGLINRGNWDKIILVKTKTAKSYPTPKSAESIIIDSSKSLIDIKKDLMNKLKGKFSEFDACLSIASGNGKEHMALISALLSLPVGIRLVVFTKKGIEFI
ncbi:MAG: hypothetical protein IIA87_02285 [Nanoarchaeota archaeon]|nr:hypothetical protein [Nanoarchaeota archaeon]